MTGPSYQYAAGLYRVIDGDTVELDVDLGFRTGVVERFRLSGIDAPERGQPGYAEASEWLLRTLAGRPLVVETRKADGFRRWLCTIYAGGENINDKMVGEGYATPWEAR